MTAVFCEAVKVPQIYIAPLINKKVGYSTQVYRCLRWFTSSVEQFVEAFQNFFEARSAFMVTGHTLVTKIT